MTKAVVYIESAQIEEVSFTTKGGEKRTMYRQNGYLYGATTMGMSPIRISLDSPATAYQPGVYDMAGSSFEVGQYGDVRVAFGGVKLVPCASDDDVAVSCLRLVDFMVNGGETVRKGK